MLKIILILVLGLSSKSFTEKVDLIELNHFHDSNGSFVYSQVIFYEWNYELNEYCVRQWTILDQRVTISRNHNNNTYSVRYKDDNERVERLIVSDFFRESWTQKDPERYNKKILDENLRKLFIKRKLKEEEVIKLP